MNIQTKNTINAIWLHGDEVCQIDHLVEVSGLSLEEIKDLIDNDLIMPTDQSSNPQYFSLHYVLIVKKARRIRDDFHLDQLGLVLALSLLEKINLLEEELSAVKAKL